MTLRISSGKFLPPRLAHIPRNWRRPPYIDWNLITEGIKQHGIRNAAQTTIAPPTGTIGTVAGVEGYGCEPVFALAYVRHVNDKGNDLILNYVSPYFQAALDAIDLSEEVKESIIEQVLDHGSCQHIEQLPQHIRNVFVVSSDITADEHIHIQAALQRFVDNSLSKTINFPRWNDRRRSWQGFHAGLETGL